MNRVNLRVVETAPKSIAEILLGMSVPSLIEAEKVVARLRSMVEEHGRTLAEERGVKFIRLEHLKQEFGK